MRTVSFQSVLNGVAMALGMVPSRDLSPARAAAMTEFINQRIVEGWKWEFWPEWTVCEQRYYRPVYDPADNVQAGDQRFFIGSGQYYQALVDQAPAAVAPAALNGSVWVTNLAAWYPCQQVFQGNDWATGSVFVLGQVCRNPVDGRWYSCVAPHVAGGAFDGAKFGAALEPFDKYVDYDQAGQTPMDEVKAVWRRNPRVMTNNPGPVLFEVSDRGVQVDWRAPSAVWIEFRLRPPVFTSEVWKAAVAYAAGSRVYAAGTTGECYVATAATNAGEEPSATPGKWARVTMPAVLAGWVKRSVFSDMLKEQKQTDRAVEELQEAVDELEDACDRALGGQGQWATAGVVAYGGGGPGAWGNSKL